MEPRLPSLQADSLPAEPQGKPKNTGVRGYPFSIRPSRPRNGTGVSCIVGRLFTNWAIREAPHSYVSERKKVKLLSRARLFATPWIVVCTKLLRPWGFQGKSTRVGCHFLLQGIFPTQGSNPGLSHCRQTLYHLSHQGKVKGENQATNVFCCYRWQRCSLS